MSHRALSVDASENLLPFSLMLQQRGIGHHIFEEGGRQILAVAEQSACDEVERLYTSWRAGELQVQVQPARSAPSRPVSLPLYAPVTLLLIALSIAGFALVMLPPLSVAIPWLTFSPFTIQGDTLAFAPMGSEYWRLVTPAFLHFGWLHIAFNGLWLWELGSRVERVMGSLNMALLFIVIALVSNAAQFVFGGPSLFGGMSGVVYGLLGFSWVAPLLQPRWQIQPPGAVMLFMVGWLVLCVAGVVTALGFGSIANAAHVGGLVTGVILGAAFGALSRSGDTGSPGRL